MKTKFIEATQDIKSGGNWGKFIVARFTEEEFARTSHIGDEQISLLRQRGWNGNFIWVGDLETGEAAFFRPDGLAAADLDKHQIWVCPLFEPFLTWLYTQDLTDIQKLPDVIELPKAEFAMCGYRRTRKARSIR